MKKAQVDKHVMKCRQCEVLSCIDCGKDFWGDDYKEHLKCISEDQKYGGKGFEAKANKGDVKQQQWMEKVHEAMNKPGVSPKLKEVLNQVSSYDNVPRKKAKFQNWMQNSLRIHNKALQDQVWEVFAAATANNGPAKAAEEQQTQNNTNDTTTEADQNGTAPTEVEPESAEPAAPLKEKKNKKNKATKAEQNGAAHAEPSTEPEAPPKQKKKKKAAKADQNGTVQPSTEPSAEPADPLKERKKNKRERKEERRQQKKQKKANGHANGQEEAEQNTEPQQTEEISKKQKKKKRKIEEVEEGEDKITNGEAESKPKKSKKASLDDSQTSEVAEGEDTEQRSKGKFNWKGTIKAVLRQSPEEGLCMKRLRKKVLAAYYSFSGDGNFRSEEELFSLFNKKVSGNPKFRVVKYKVRLVK